MPSFPVPLRTRFRGAAALAVAAVLALVGAGCTPEEPEPTPTPTPTGFASEEEALEAARATFERYVEATNNVDFGDLETAEPVYEWLTGDALTSAKQVYSESHAEGHRRTGRSIVVLAEIREFDAAQHELSIDACLDVSAVDVLDADGNSLVSPDRPSVQTLQASFEFSGETETGLLISTTSGREDGPSCEDLG